MKHLLSLNELILKYKFHFFGGIFFIAISNFFGVIYTQVFRYALDMIAESLNVFNLISSAQLKEAARIYFVECLVIFGLVIMALAILKGVFMFFMRQSIIVMSHRVVFDLKNKLFNKYQTLDLGFYKRSNTGDLMSRISEDTGKVRMYLGPGIMYAINLVTVFVMVIYTMVNVNLKLTLYTLAPLPVLAIGIYLVNSRILAQSKLIQKQLAHLTVFCQETFSGIRIIKTYNREKAFKDEFNEESTNFKTKSLQLARIDAVFQPLMVLMVGLSTILTIYIGGIQISEGEITPGNILEFIIYINMLTWPVAAIGWVVSMVQQAEASQERLNYIMGMTPIIDKEIGKKIELKGEISFREVGFTYPDSGIEALKNVSFTIEAGKSLGIIGKTGSGKSTIAALLTRLYDIDKGSIEYDGEEIKNLNPSYLRSQIGMVPQDVFLFSDTIKNNILFGNIDATDDDVARAAKIASLTHSIAEFAQGYETILGERGINLSGGQKQRVSIARAIVRAPKVFIFDDCLSALDTNTEKEVLGGLSDISKNTTSVIISHRISSVMNCDNILVLEQGKIAEIGTHEALLSLEGYYHRIYEKQQIEQEDTA